MSILQTFDAPNQHSYQFNIRRGLVLSLVFPSLNALGGIATVEQIRKAMEDYAPVLGMYGDPERGKRMFVEATCSTCHRFQDVGTRIGPDLETLIDRSPVASSLPPGNNASKNR